MKTRETRVLLPEVCRWESLRFFEEAIGSEGVCLDKDSKEDGYFSILGVGEFKVPEGHT